MALDPEAILYKLGLSGLGVKNQNLSLWGWDPGVTTFCCCFLSFSPLFKTDLYVLHKHTEEYYQDKGVDQGRKFSLACMKLWVLSPAP